MPDKEDHNTGIMLVLYIFKGIVNNCGGFYYLCTGLHLNRLKWRRSFDFVVRTRVHTWIAPRFVLQNQLHENLSAILFMTSLFNTISPIKRKIYKREWIKVVFRGASSGFLRWRIQR